MAITNTTPATALNLAAILAGAKQPGGAQPTEAPVGQTDAVTPEAAAPVKDTGLEAAKGEKASTSLEDLFPAQGSESVEADKVVGKGATSVGDPHETTGDGMKFDNMQQGVFVKMRSALGDFEVQSRQEPWEKNPQATVNTGVAVKLNAQGDVARVDAAGKITFNGKDVEVKEGQPFEIPGGGTIEKQGDYVIMTSAAGDKVTTLDRGTYLDMRIDPGADRRDGDMAGSLGRMDSDTDFTNDLVDRDGKPMTDIDAFIEAWRAEDGESMFGDAPVGTPEQPADEKPADKPAEAVTEPKGGAAQPVDQQQVVALLEQLTTLLNGHPAPKEAEVAEQPQPTPKTPATPAAPATGISPEVLALLTQLLKALEADEQDDAEAEQAA